MFSLYSRPTSNILKSLRYRTKRVCTTACHVLGWGHANCLWKNGSLVTLRYCELSVTEFLFVFLYFAQLFALFYARAYAFKSSFLSFFFFILFVVLPFAACWVHTGYSAFKIHSCETCVLNSAAICCRKRTYS